MLQVFEPYAKFWLSGLIQLVVNGNTGGDGIHYMVVDIVVVLLGWAKVAIPEVSTIFIYLFNLKKLEKIQKYIIITIKGT